MKSNNPTAPPMSTSLTLTAVSHSVVCELPRQNFEYGWILPCFSMTVGIHLNHLQINICLEVAVS